MKLDIEPVALALRRDTEIEGPQGDEAAEVLADWCWAHGLDRAAGALLEPGPRRRRALFALAILFGDTPTVLDIRAAYDELVPLPSLYIGGCDHAVIDFEVRRSFRLRKILIPNALGHLDFYALKLSDGTFLLGDETAFLEKYDHIPTDHPLNDLQKEGSYPYPKSDPVPGAVFKEKARDTFDDTLPAGPARLVVMNPTRSGMEFRGCLLGRRLR